MQPHDPLVFSLVTDEFSVVVLLQGGRLSHDLLRGGVSSVIYLDKVKVNMSAVRENSFARPITNERFIFEFTREFSLVCALFGAQVSSYRAQRAEHGGSFLLQFGAWKDVDLSEKILPKL